MLSAGLAQLAEGKGDALLQLADLYDGRAKDGSYDNSQDAFLAIRCVDDPAITDQAVTDKQDAEFRKVAPFLDDGHGTGPAPLDLCAFWPVPNSGTPHNDLDAGPAEDRGRLHHRGSGHAVSGGRGPGSVSSARR